MSPAQRREAGRKEKTLAKYQRVHTLASLLEMYEHAPHQDTEHILGLRHRLTKARNELRNMVGETN